MADKLAESVQEMDQAFELWRKNHYGAYCEYPIDAYTHFGAGWRAAMALTINLALDARSAGAAEMKERCANVCDEANKEDEWQGGFTEPSEIAAAIRALK
jgi:hypothetical protein